MRPCPTWSSPASTFPNRSPATKSLVASSIAILAAASAAPAADLSNERVTAHFGDRGLTSLYDNTSKTTWHFAKDEFSLKLSGQTIESASLATPSRQITNDRVTYSYTAGPYKIDVVYETPRTARFRTHFRTPPRVFTVCGMLMASSTNL